MDYSDTEAEVRKRMMAACQKVILLCDHTKFDHPAFYKICSYSEVDVLITDRKPGDAWENLLQHNGVELIYTAE
jgi:DeoR/GlpR family transcriptional regulator of sugar metabolism